MTGPVDATDTSAPGSPASATAPDAAAAAPDDIEVRDGAGRLTFRGQVGDDGPTGESIEWGPKNKPSQRAAVIKGKLHGELRRYDEDGNLVQVARYADGLAHGPTIFYQHSRLLCRMLYVRGVLEGEAVYYSPNGQVSARLPYRAGKIEGVAQYYNQEGVLLRSVTHAADQPNGPAMGYYESGAIQETSSYKAGLLEGEVKRYYPSGKLLQYGVYRQGLLVTPLQTFAEDGRQLAVQQPGQTAKGG